MISIEARKFLLRLILVLLYTNHTHGCDSNKQLYTEIGCKPVYDGSNSCPVAYDCDNVFTRPNDKCYINGNVYEPLARLSKTDLALEPCLAACFCDQTLNNNKTVTKITCATVECPSYFTRLAKPCYYQFERDSCCEVKKFCPEEKSIVHECTYEGNVYKNGQRIYIGNDVKCVCSETFNGTASDPSCRKIGCSSEIRHAENFLKWSAPVFYGKGDGCPIDWFHSDYDMAVAGTTGDSKSTNRECRYGHQRFLVGQSVIIGGGVFADSDVYQTTCSCDVPPLITCVKVRKASV